MTHNQFKLDKVEDMLSWIYEGMPVYDIDDRKVGKVRDMHFADGSEQALAAKPEGFYNLPLEVQGRLARYGFIQIDCGIFAPDRCVTPDQIADLTDDAIRLHVTRDELVTI
jgi:hypothetical protein